MKRMSLVIVAFTTAVLCYSRPIDACGYGLMDPDIETFCSGDPNQAKQALANLAKRGPNVMKAIKAYRDRAVLQKKSNEQYLTQLQTPERVLKMAPERVEKEIQRVKNWLEWNEGRMVKVDYLSLRFGGWTQFILHQ